MTCFIQMAILELNETRSAVDTMTHIHHCPVCTSHVHRARMTSDVVLLC